MKTKKVNGRRFVRALRLRRALIPHVLAAGFTYAGRGKQGQRFVTLSDDFDDVVYAALEHEAELERARRGARP